MNGHQTFFRIRQPSVPKTDGVSVQPWTVIASRDGKPGIKAAGVKHSQLLDEAEDDNPSVGGNVNNLVVEFDRMDLLARLQRDKRG